MKGIFKFSTPAESRNKNTELCKKSFVADFHSTYYIQHNTEKASSHLTTLPNSDPFFPKPVQRLGSCFITCRIDYCRVLFSAFSKQSVNKLKLFQNAALNQEFWNVCPGCLSASVSQRFWAFLFIRFPFFSDFHSFSKLTYKHAVMDVLSFVSSEFDFNLVSFSLSQIIL